MNEVKGQSQIRRIRESPTKRWPSRWGPHRSGIVETIKWYIEACCQAHRLTCPVTQREIEKKPMCPDISKQTL